jgi:hypothetical protein
MLVTNTLSGTVKDRARGGADEIGMPVAGKLVRPAP